MISKRVVLALALAVLVFAAPAARAQYMYLDTNGNGVHDAGDQIKVNGTATTVDVWINTNHNRDGSLAVCDVDGTSPLGINSYVVNLLAANGLVSYGGFTNLFPGTVNFGEVNPGDGLRYKNGFGSPNTQPPGVYRLASLTITGLSGSPRVDIVDLVSGSNDFTSFGTGVAGCFGNDFDNTYKLRGPAGGTDWTDVDGLAPATPIDTPPVVNNPGNKTVNEGDCLNFAVTGSAPNGHSISFFLIVNPPSGASITTGGQFSWCPTEAQGPGDYAVTVSVMDNVTSLTSATTFQVHVNELNQPPVLNPIGDKTVNFGHILSFFLTTADPDVPSNALTFSVDPGAPSGMSIIGNFVQWNPMGNVSQPGIYPFTIRVTDNGVPPLSDAKTFNVTVQPAGTGAPTINNPGDLTVQAGTVVNQPITGSDPNNLPLTFTKGSGPVFVTVTTVNATTGNINIATSLSDVGTYPLTVIANNGIETAQTTFNIIVTPGDNPPVLQTPANMTVAEGDVADQTVTGSDPDNTPLTFTKSSGPLFMTVTTTTSTTGNIHLAPGSADAGSYLASVRVSDGQLIDQKNLNITVLNVCQAPTANAGGPYSGFVNVPVMFNGSGSSDPDGGALSYAWNFGDGTAGTGPTPSHTYTAFGSYLVTLRVTNPCGRFADAAVTANITGGCTDALAFTQGGNSKTSLGSGRPQTCFQIQPVNGGFSIQDVDLASIVMISQGTGSVSEIHAISNKTAVGTDKNGDGIDEISACFTKADLQQLFSNIQGTQVVNVRIEGDLFTGGSFCTTLDHTVKAGGGGGQASVRPNPLNPSAVLTFSTTRAGAAKVQLFDMQGRLIKTLLDQPTTAAGYHDVRIDGRDATGNRLASGVYYLRIQSVEGAESKAITILK
jgi:PKD domain-containing protein/flagellar hook capping protein FlgD